ncbi:MAG: thiamine pyrophosphate-dependent enzyme, partial [Oscillospiraceae bacterium]
IIVMRNGQLGMVRELQNAAYGGRHAAVDLFGSPDIGKLAEAYGIEHLTIETSDRIDYAVDKLLETKGLFILECVVSAEERSL